MKKKKVLSLLLTAAMIIGLLPTTVLADGEESAPAPRTTALDLTETETTDSLADEGWAWDADTKTLTLDGLNLSVSSGHAITVPDGTTIVLAAGSVNTIETTAASSSKPYGIFTEGTLTIKSADPDNKGALNITSTSRGIGHQSNLTENKNFPLSISDIKLYTNAVVGINMRPTNSGYDSNLTVSMSGVDYTYACSTIFQMVTDDGGSCLNLTGSNITGTGDGAVLISGTDTAALTVNNSALTATGYINVGNRKPKSAVLDVQENSTVTTNRYVWISPRDEEGSSGTLNVTKSSLAVEENLFVGERYADVSIATVMDRSTVNVVGDITIGSIYSNATTKNSKSELTVSGSTLTTESSLYIQRGTVSTMTVKEDSSVTSKEALYVGSDSDDIEKAELIVSNSSLTAGMGDMAESIVVGNTGAEASSATITNSTVIAVSESKGGIQLYPKTGNTGGFVASGSTFFVASKNGGSEIPEEGNHVTTVQFAEPATRDSDGNLIFPAGTTITSGGETYTVAEGNTPTITYDATGSMQIPAGTVLKLDDGVTIKSDGALTFEPGQAPQLEKGRTITFTVDGSSYTIDAIDDQTYAGVALEPVVVMKKDNVDMPESITIEYEDNIDAGMATVIIKDEGKKVLSTVFKILPKDITNAEITLGDVLTYNGTEQTQTVASVVIDGLTVTYENLTGNVQTNVGNYILSVTGTGNFTGTAKKEWNIKPTPDIMITPDHNSLYGGGKVTLTFNTMGSSRIASIRMTYGGVADLTKYTPTKEGYIFTGWYSDKELTEAVTSVKLTKNTTVYAGWELINPFKDVADGDWYYEAVLYAYEHGLMSGYGNGLFGPNDTTSRGMIVTILYRLENNPTTQQVDLFSDVSAGAYYHDAVLWAYEKGIMGGYGGGVFGPNDPITREQLAAVLWRYAKYKGMDVSVGESTNLLSYKDFAQISEYAIPALQWAAGEGIMQGDAGSLMPKGSATRAHAAAMLMRFLTAE